MLFAKLLVTVVSLYGAYSIAALAWKHGKPERAGFTRELASFALVVFAASLLVVQALVLGVWASPP